MQSGVFSVNILPVYLLPLVIIHVLRRLFVSYKVHAVHKWGNANRKLGIVTESMNTTRGVGMKRPIFACLQKTLLEC